MGQAFVIERIPAPAMEPVETPQLASRPEWRYTDGDKITSINSRFCVNMCFTNRTNNVVEAFWLNFEGKEVTYGLIKPGTTSLLYTYLTHPWVFRNKENSEEVLVVNGKPVSWPTQALTYADIVEPPFLRWSPTTHVSEYRKRAPAFARDVQNLLLAYCTQHRSGSRQSTPAGCRANSSGQRGSAGREHAGAEGRRNSTNSYDYGSPSRTGCCGAKLWSLRVHEDEVQSHGAGAAPSVANSAYTTPSRTLLEADTAPTEAHRTEPCLLGLLPFDVILDIIAQMAPALREFKPLVKEEMQLLPRGVEPSVGPVAHLAAQLLGPNVPPPPAVGHAAWFAAAAAGFVGQVNVDAANAPVAVPEGPLGAGALAPQAQVLGAGDGMQLPAANAAEVAEVVRYMESMALSNAAQVHAESMAQQQQAQAVVLLARIQAEAAAAAAAAARAEKEQEQPQQVDGPVPNAIQGPGQDEVEDGGQDEVEAVAAAGLQAPVDDAPQVV